MHPIRNQITALLLGAATVTGIMLPAATAQAAPVEQHSPAVISSEMAALGISVDVVTNTVNITGKLYSIISAAIAQNQNRSGYVKSLMEGSFYDARQRYNVMVIKAGHNYTANLKNIVYDATVHGSDYPAFRVIVFSSGTFTNRGDGGWINWAFRGWFNRDGMTVNFRRP
ncbi:hypothetical protein [Amycolatopsis sp.]|jgi:hypothetical protein|uniref:hypothetical protein n=1 Tax=Amycolatopsis sp. TaxID=37632 RepID=UPI002DFD4CB5|nr:hypothetical protein [Amycolatopsis sp.]